MARLNFNVPGEILTSYRRTKLREIIDEFMESGADVAEYLFANGEYKNSESVRNALNTHIKKRMLPVEVFTRGGRVYLGRKEIDNA